MAKTEPIFGKSEFSRASAGFAFDRTGSSFAKIRHHFWPKGAPVSENLDPVLADLDSDLARPNPVLGRESPENRQKDPVLGQMESVWPETGQKETASACTGSCVNQILIKAPLGILKGFDKPAQGASPGDIRNCTFGAVSCLGAASQAVVMIDHHPGQAVRGFALTVPCPNARIRPVNPAPIPPPPRDRPYPFGQTFFGSLKF